MVVILPESIIIVLILLEIIIIVVILPEMIRIVLLSMIFMFSLISYDQVSVDLMFCH